MTLGDLAIARNLQEYETFDRSGRALRALSTISDGIKQHVAATENAGFRIASSVDALERIGRRNNYLLGDINLALGAISDELYEGFSQVAYEQRLQTSTLKDILAAVSSPNATAAREFRDQGFYAYSNGWLDDAETALRKASHKDPFDFTVHQLLGDIALRRGANITEAIEEFAKAAKYAEPVSAADSAYALMCQTRAHRARGTVDESVTAARKAAVLIPAMAEGHFALAQAAAYAQDRTTAREALLKALSIKPELSLLAADDELLGAIDGLAEETLIFYRQTLRDDVMAEWQNVRPKLDAALRFGSVIIEAHEVNQAALQREAAKKRSLFADRAEDIPRWAVAKALPPLGARAREVTSLIEASITADSILDLVQAKTLILGEGVSVCQQAIPVLRRQYLVNGLSPEVAASLLALIRVVDPRATRTAACPYCGFTVSEWDDVCRKCGSIFKGRLEVPERLASAYKRWTTTGQNWPGFLATLEASWAELPQGPGAAARINARFPEAAGRSGFAEIVNRFDSA